MARADLPEADLLAGGTDLMVEVNMARYRPESVISLGAVDELRHSTTTRIGSGVTWQTLESSEHKALAQLARTIG